MLDNRILAQPDPECQSSTIMDKPIRDADLIALGRALRSLRDRAGITQEQLAALLEMDATYISRIERGRRGVQWLTVQRFLRALDSDLHQLANAITEGQGSGSDT
jgi:transcriptional regulator with XRE-family HTH domain